MLGGCRSRRPQRRSRLRASHHAAAAEVLAADLLVRGDREETGDRVEARQWLTDFLTDGPKPAQEVFQKGEKEGFSESTLKRAKKDIGVKPVKRGYGKEGQWCWKLSKEDQHSSKGVQEAGPEPLKVTSCRERASGADSLKGVSQWEVSPLMGALSPLSLPLLIDRTLSGR